MNDWPTDVNASILAFAVSCSILTIAALFFAISTFFCSSVFFVSANIIAF